MKGSKFWLFGIKSLTLKTESKKRFIMEKKEMKYSEAIAELESITAKMQSPDCDIDSLAGLTSRALELLKICKEKLFKTDEEVRKCLETLSDSLG